MENRGGTRAYDSANDSMVARLDSAGDDCRSFGARGRSAQEIGRRRAAAGETTAREDHRRILDPSRIASFREGRTRRSTCR